MKYSQLSVFIRQIKEFGKQRLLYAWVLFGIGVLCSGLTPVLAALISYDIVQLITAQAEYEFLLKHVLFFTVLLILFFSAGTVLQRMFEICTYDLRDRKYESLTEMYHRISFAKIEDPQFEDRIQTGVRALESDGWGFQDVYNRLYRIVSGLITIMVFLLMMSLRIPWIAAAYGCFMILDAVSNMLYAEYDASRKQEQERAERRSRYFNTAMSDFAFGKDIRLFSLQKYLSRRYQKESDAFVQVSKEINEHSFRYGFFDFLGILIVSAVSWSLTGRAYLQGTITLPSALLYLSMTITMTGTGNTLIENVTVMIQELTSSAVYYRTMDEEDQTEVHNGLSALPQDHPVEIVLDHVWFRYPHTQRYVLKDFSLRIQAGEKIGIVGLNGAGKSTLVKLICGLYQPEKGSILINGVSQKAFDPSAYMKMFSTVFQDFTVYPCTLLENVCGSDAKEADRDRAKQCLDAVGLKQKIAELPDGYDSIANQAIDERGIDLSGGQKQRVAIARALYKNGNVIILDEPTASLDALAEAEIYRSFDHLSAGKTSIYISHRLSSTRFCDRILLLDQNGIVEEGSHDALMAKHGTYYEMFVTQGKYYQKEGAPA